MDTNEKKLKEEHIKKLYCSNCLNKEKCEKENIDVTKCDISCY